jgi:hypothetical protein
MRKVYIVSVLLVGSLAIRALAFEAKDLDGLWAESMQNRYACTPTNRHQRFELSTDLKTLTITTVPRFSKQASVTIHLLVTKTDDKSIYFRFPGEHSPSDPLAGEFAITMIGPGVYRWHVTSEHEALKPAPIGIRCEP